MAAGDITIFDEAKLAFFQGVHGSSDTYKCAILDNTATPAAGTATPTLGDFTEVGTAGTYTAGGTAVTLSLTEAAGTVTWDLTVNPSWTGDASNDTNAYWGLIYNDTSTGDQAIAFVDLGGPVTMVNDLDITWNASGVFTAA